MPHVVYVDLSAKAEQFDQDSAVAVSNDTVWVYLVPARVKRQLRVQITTQHGTHNLQYRVLAVLIYATVKPHLSEIHQIVIDRDYTGASTEGTIRNLLLHLLRRDRPDVTAGFVRFENVKGSAADKTARQVFRRKREPERILSFAEIRPILGKTKGLGKSTKGT
jgi:hypothetical protein